MTLLTEILFRQITQSVETRLLIALHLVQALLIAAFESHATFFFGLLLEHSFGEAGVDDDR